MAKFLGDCKDNFKASENGIAKNINATKVPDWKCPDDLGYNAGGIDPYPRLVSGGYPGGGGDCPGGSALCDDEATRSCAMGHPGAHEFCAPWPDADKPVGGINHNIYTNVGFEDLARCWKIGWKGVQCLHPWHGRFGFLSHDPSGRSLPLEPEDMVSPLCGGCVFEAEQPAADDNKFLRMRKTVTATVGLASDTMTREYAINRLSGLTTEIACADADPSPGRGDASNAGVLTNYSYGKMPISTVVLTPPAGDDSGCPNPGSMAGMGDVVTRILACYAGGFTPTVSSSDFGNCTWTDGNPLGPFWTIVTSNSGNHLVFTHGPAGTLSAVVDIQNTAYTWTVTGTNFSAVFSATFDTDPIYSYGATDHYNDCVALLDEWDLTDDVVYPWRVDAYVSACPLVTYNGYQGIVTPDQTQACGYVDPHAGGGGSEPVYDDSIRGSPLPRGYEEAFDWDHITYKVCEDGLGGLNWYQYTLGAQSHTALALDATDTAQPMSATQWTDNQLACYLYPWAFIAMGADQGDFKIGLSGGVGYMQKWAEARIVRPRWNFKRPCGDDKYLLDQDTVRCVTAYNAGTQTLTILSATGIITNDRVGICGVSGVSDGCYKITKIDATHYQINGDFDAHTFDLDCGTGIIGLQRFPSAGNCAGDCNTTKPEGYFVYGEWRHNFRDYQERNRVIAQYTSCSSCAAAAPASSTPIRQYQGANGMPQSVKSGVSSGDDVAVEHQIAYSSCNPVVMCISPNGESWPTGITFDFPGAFADHRYGALWQAAIIQHMQDPLWQPPHKRCIPGCSGGDNEETHCTPTEDCGNGSACCQADACPDDCSGGTYFYAQRPWVEARLSLPACSAGLPSGIFIDYLSLTDLDSATPPDGNVLPPPEVMSFNYSPGIQLPGTSINGWDYQLPWVLYLNERECVCDVGTFASNYESDGVGC